MKLSGATDALSYVSHVSGQTRGTSDVVSEGGWRWVVEGGQASGCSLCHWPGTGSASAPRDITKH